MEPENSLLAFPLRVLRYPPITISESDDIWSTVFVVSSPLIEIAGVPVISRVDCSVPFTYMLIEVPLKVAATCVQFFTIWVAELTVCHFMPSKTENVAVFVGGMMLLMESWN